MAEPRKVIFPEGMSFRLPNAKAPDWIRGNMSFNVDRFTKFLQDHKDARGWVNIDLKKSLKGEYYLQLNDFKPKPKENDRMDLSYEGNASTAAADASVANDSMVDIPIINLDEEDADQSIPF
jgi:hypothetical protein